MIKNQSGQIVGAQMIAASDGSAFTGTVSVAVTVDGGTQGAGGGTVTHEGGGFHTYTPTQAETNGDHVAFTFSGTGAVSQTVQAYTRAGDAYTAVQALNDLSAAQVNAEVDTALADYDPPTRAELASDVSGLTSLINIVDGNVDDIEALLGLVDLDVTAALALLDDPRTEPGQGAPPVNPDLATKIDYLYKAWRNKKDNDGTETKLYADNGTTVDHKQATSEAGGTVTKSEWATGA